MYRYHLIASFDKSLHALASETVQETSTINIQIPLLTSTGSFRYGLQRTVDELRRYNIYPSETGFDIIILGILVYMADMKISRREQAQDSWSREIILTVPLFDDRWSKYNGLFERMLKFLTGDLWTVGFTRRETKLAQEDKFCSRTTKYTVASLFSGGMDSLIAAINYMEKDQPTLLVSHAGESRVRHWQTDLLSVLNEKYGDVPHENAYYWTNLDGIEFPEAGSDLNQRSRSFLFIAIALFSMSGTEECTQLLMPENGLIALNVPLEYLRLGSHSTRTTHPFYLKLWNEVAYDIFGFSISNPYWNKTKGEMAAECLNREVLKVAMAQSYSCSSVNTVSIHSGKSNHCGHCLPCIIRRAAMHKAFGDFDPSVYMDSNVTELVNNRETKGEQIRSFQYAIERLKNNPEAKDALIHKPGPLEMDDAYLNELADVYYRGLMEVDKWIQDSLEKENAN
ncbi:Qat anti-phage system QueC-like protein QatC [Oribacterium sp. NK2B42]|uniref:Qat anti-phage system QueC-like protein QatC n=1 Tax=Oribacterium sp. NK2B42 TaxID=689781 RepID=UPI0004022160|nr:Qat anti-phage system QueC-like protein QatC [Oribacterium sp. NK2B42]